MSVSDSENGSNNQSQSRSRSSLPQSDRAVDKSSSIRSKMVLELIVKPKKLILEPIKYDINFFKLLQKNPMMIYKLKAKK